MLQVLPEARGPPTVPSTVPSPWQCLRVFYEPRSTNPKTKIAAIRRQLHSIQCKGCAAVSYRDHVVADFQYLQSRLVLQIGHLA